MPVLQLLLVLLLASKVFAVGIAASLSWWWLALIYVVVSAGRFISTFIASFISAAAVELFKDETPKQNTFSTDGIRKIIQKK